MQSLLSESLLVNIKMQKDKGQLILSEKVGGHQLRGKLPSVEKSFSRFWLIFQF
jgi:hypothetical protein